MLVLLLSFFLLAHDLFTVSKQLAIRFQRNFACILMGSVRIAVQNFIDLVFDLDLSRSQMCKITFWAIPRFLLDKSSPNFKHRVAWVGDFQQIKKYLERFERETYANALRWPPLCKMTSLTITLKVRHIG